jgi:hypothetical protein
LDAGVLERLKYPEMGQRTGTAAGQYDREGLLGEPGDEGT